jgi:hypothetical protein
MSKRASPSGANLHLLAPDDRAYRRSLTDEVAIDFPSASVAAECLRRSVAEPDVPGVEAEIVLDELQAACGAVVPVWLDLRHTCPACGGRGEVWDEACEGCLGVGHAVSPLSVEVRVPPGAAHGDRLRFSVTPRRGPRTRVDLRLAVRR